MRNFQQKRNKQFWQSWPILIILIILVLIFAWNVFAFWQKMQNTSKNRKIAEEKISQLEQQKERLSNDIAKLNTEKGVEEAIRDKFGLVKEGEGMIVIVEDQNKEVPPIPSKFSRFMSFLGNLFK
jgi:cell division protein FtsB